MHGIERTLLWHSLTACLTEKVPQPQFRGTFDKKQIELQPVNTRASCMEWREHYSEFTHCLPDRESASTTALPGERDVDMTLNLLPFRSLQHTSAPAAWGPNTAATLSLAKRSGKIVAGRIDMTFFLCKIVPATKLGTCQNKGHQCSWHQRSNRNVLPEPNVTFACNRVQSLGEGRETRKRERTKAFSNFISEK